MNQSAITIKPQLEAPASLLPMRTATHLVDKRLVVGFGLAILFAVATISAPASLAQEASAYTYVTEWQIPPAQWATWEAFEQSSFRPALSKLFVDNVISDWGLYTYANRTPQAPTHGLWFSVATLAGVGAALDATGKAPSVLMDDPQVKQRNFLFRHLASGGRAADGSGGVLWVHRTQSAPEEAERSPDGWQKSIKPMLDDLVAKGIVFSYGIEREHMSTQASAAFYIHCLMPNAGAADKFLSALGGVLSKMAAAEQNEFNAAQLPEEQERMALVGSFALADPALKK